MKNIQNHAFELIKPIAENLGYVLVEVTYKKEFSGNVLAVTIDKPNGINLDDCEALSKAIDEPLDLADLTDGVAYNLNVSSYGLDRKLSTEYDFNKFKNKEIVVKFYKPFQNGKKEIVAKLLNFTNDTIIVEFNNEQIELKRTDLAVIMPYIKF